MLENLIVRPVKRKDLEDLVTLANTTAPGLTSLPKNKEILKQKIEWSIESFDKYVIIPKQELYFFVCEDSLTQKIIGTTAILSSVGGKNPFYSYVILQDEQSWNGKEKINEYLKISTSIDPVSELCTLYVHPEYRSSGVGRLLSLVRFMFISQQLKRFRKTVITEFRGISYPNGKCPFWDYVMYSFFGMSFSEAQALSEKDSLIMNQLVPKHPIYLKLLPHFINNIIGAVHDSSKGAEKILSLEGFYKSKYIDIFDAGPKYEAKTKSIKAVNRVLNCNKVKISETIKNHNLYIVNSGKVNNFVACCLPLKVNDNITHIEVYPTLAFQKLMSNGKLNHYMKLIPNSRQLQRESTSLLDKVSIQTKKDFSIKFSKWHEKLSTKSYK